MTDDILPINSYLEKFLSGENNKFNSQGFKGICHLGLPIVKWALMGNDAKNSFFMEFLTEMDT